MKKIVSILVVVAMLMSMIPTVFADETEPIGSYYNPEVITEPGDYIAPVPSGWDGYYYSYTVETSGAVIFTINETDNWIYWVYNTSTGDEAYMYSSSGDPTTCTLEVAAGDTVLINVMKDDQTEGTISFNIAKVDYEVEKVVKLEATDWTLPCETVEIPAGDKVKYEVTNGMDGGQLTVTGENVYVEIEGETLYPDEEGVIYIDFTNYEGEAEMGWFGVTYKYIMYIGNAGSEAAVFWLGADYPVGTYSNPEVIEANLTYTAEIQYDDTGLYGGYYYQFVAPEGCLVSVTVESDALWTFTMINETTYTYGENLAAVNGDANSQSLVAYAGDVIVINVSTLDENYVCPGGSVNVTVTCEAVDIFPGSEYDPYMISSYDGTVYTDEIPAGGEYYFTLSGFSGNQIQIKGENAYLVMDGVTYTPDADGVILVSVSGYPTVVIGNSGTEAASFEVTCIYPLGSYNNPDQLLLDTEYSVTREYGAGYYYFTWVAEEMGVFTATMLSDSNWRFYIQNSGSWKTTATHFFDDDPLVTSDSLVVTAGDKITVYVSTYDGNYMTPAGDFSVIFSFEAINTDGFLYMGDNDLELEEGDSDGCTWTYTAEESGTLNVAVTGMGMNDVFGDYFNATEDDITNYFARGSYVLLVNEADGSAAVQSIEVAEGDIITVQLYSAMAAWTEVTITLSMAEEEQEPVYIGLGDNEIYYDSVGATLVFTPDESGTLTIEGTMAGIYDDWFESWTYLTEAELPDVFWMLGLTINGEEVLSNPVSFEVEAGVPVTITLCDMYSRPGMIVLDLSMDGEGGADAPWGSETNPIEIQGLPCNLSTEITEDNLESGVYYQYVAEMDGIILADAFEGYYVTVLVNGEPAFLEDGVNVLAGDVVVFNVWAFEDGKYETVLFYKPGTYANPDVVTYYENLGEVYLAVGEISEGSEDGYWWSMTAAESGVLYVLTTASLADGTTTDDFCVYVYVNNDFYSSFSFNGNSNPVVTLPVSEGDEILINVCANEGQYLKAMVNAFIVEGTVADPVTIGKDGYLSLPVDANSSLAFFDGTIDAHWSSNGLIVSAEDPEVMGETTVKVYVDGVETAVFTDEDGDGKIIVDAPAGSVIVIENGTEYVVNYSVVSIPVGDVNGDGLVDSDDASLILKYDVGLIGEDGLNLNGADVNGDGVVDSDDASLILKYDVGLSEGF